MKKTYQIWSEGYSATGESSGAIFLGKFEGNNFDEAVENYNKQVTEDGMMARQNDRKRYRSDKDYENRKSNWNIWACNLFDNELDARKSFG